MDKDQTFIGIQVPSQFAEAGKVLMEAVENDNKSSITWWRLIHFLHARCNADSNLLIKLCEQASSNIEISKNDLDEDNSLAKILLAQCKFLYANKQSEDALRIYKKMRKEKIGVHLYYFWINFAAILYKVQSTTKAIFVLEESLQLNHFSDDDRQKIEAALEGYLKSAENTHTEENLQTPNASNEKKQKKQENEEIKNTPNIVALNTESNSARSSTGRRQIAHFPSKFPTGPSRIKTPPSTSSGATSQKSTKPTPSPALAPLKQVTNSKINSKIATKPTTASKKVEKNPAKPLEKTPLSSVTQKKQTPLQSSLPKKTVAAVPSQNRKPEQTPVQVFHDPSESSEGSPKKPSVQKRASPEEEKKPQKSEDPEQVLQEMKVNENIFYKLALIGKGGSSRVYKCVGFLEEKKSEIFAIKQVDLSDQDEETCSGFLNEIKLLRSLKHESQIVHLYDHQISGGKLLLVLELGEVDLKQLLHRLKRQENQRIQLNLIKMYWQQMLEAVEVIHSHRIVHGDLKPANFVSFKGILKLIDFGIAGAIQSNTTNIKRDSMVCCILFLSFLV